MVMTKNSTTKKSGLSIGKTRMVQAVAAGESITQIARNEQCSRAWVTRELASNECDHFLTELMNYERERTLNLRSEERRVGKGCGDEPATKPGIDRLVTGTLSTNVPGDISVWS